MIDIRSDTVTVPTEEMRMAIARAQVGDDVFSEDPTVFELEEFAAALLGKEAALYVPSGVMANQIAINILTQPGDEVIVESEAHIFQYEAASPSILSGVQLRCAITERGIIEAKDIENLINPENDHKPRTSLVCIENTHNRHGGTIFPIYKIKELKEFIDEHHLSFHCDGARLWNASVETGIEPKEFAQAFDTVSVCLSKALGAPIGSLIVSTKENIKKARKFRKVLGGGMRQVGIIASAGLYALKHNRELLSETHENAKLFAKILSESEFIEVELNRVETNIVIFKHPAQIISELIDTQCFKNGVRIIKFGKNTFRAVFHFQVSREETISAANVVKDVINALVSGAGERRSGDEEEVH